MKIEIAKSLLNRFVSTDKGSWMNTPTNVGRKTVATNGYRLISVPKQGWCKTDNSAKFVNVLPVRKNMERVILVSKIKEKLKDFPMVDCHDKVTMSCLDCGGGGSVTFKFRSCNDGEYTTESDCPVCDTRCKVAGYDNKPNGEKELDKTEFFQIGHCIFHIDRISELMFVAETLGVESVVLANQTASSMSSLFIVGEAEVLLMPHVNPSKVPAKSI